MKINRSVLSDVSNNPLNSLDQVLDQRNANKNQEVEISDSLIQEYNLDLFNEQNTDIGVADYATHLFYDNANLDSNLSQTQTENLFSEDLDYHQSNITSANMSRVFIGIWIVLILVICTLITKIIRRRKEYAKKNRNRVQTAQLYY